MDITSRIQQIRDSIDDDYSTFQVGPKPHERCALRNAVRGLVAIVEEQHRTITQLESDVSTAYDILIERELDPGPQNGAEVAVSGIEDEFEANATVNDWIVFGSAEDVLNFLAGR